MRLQLARGRPPFPTPAKVSSGRAWGCGQAGETKGWHWLAALSWQAHLGRNLALPRVLMPS
jgi:hypothetical protein